MQYTLVTVAHLLDLPLLKLQARSLNHYLDRRFVKDIIVVDNSTNGALPPDQLLPQYGNLPVRVIKAADITPVPQGTYGWFTQQIYKLLVAKHVTTERYIILDAKTHLVDPLDSTMFDAPDGRIRAGRYRYGHHTLRRYLLRCCEYLHVEPPAVMDCMLATTPPFTMMTEVVRSLVADIEKRENCPFAEAFLRRGLTEFFLYGTYIVATGHELAEFYKFDNWMGTTLWKENGDKHMQWQIAHPERVFFAVHRGTFKNMNPLTQHSLAHFWHSRRLFSSFQDALRFVKGCAITYKAKPAT
jgi:hypothetical protein